MIHTPGVYYSIKLPASAYQGKAMAFIRDQWVTNMLTLVCLPTTKYWEWHTDNAIKDVDKFHEYHSDAANQGTLWAPGANNGAPKAMPTPNLLAIPNALVDLLHIQGPSITPNNILPTVDMFIESSSHPPDQE